jgi:hypothetical protein
VSPSDQLYLRVAANIAMPIAAGNCQLVDNASIGVAVYPVERADSMRAAARSSTGPNQAEYQHHSAVGSVALSLHPIASVFFVDADDLADCLG